VGLDVSQCLQQDSLAAKEDLAGCSQLAQHVHVIISK